ncbi:synaptotagmin-3, partial [Columba livia]|uniref:synaptotagmin-3 n=1 Tax=Columba livia TaxID=8932 RepID=UPI0031BA35BA
GLGGEEGRGDSKCPPSGVIWIWGRVLRGGGLGGPAPPPLVAPPPPGQGTPQVAPVGHPDIGGDAAGGALSSATSQQHVGALGSSPPVSEDKPDPPPSAPGLGQIQPELYGDGDGARGAAPTCGRLAVALRYAYGSQQLLVRVLRAVELPPKDPNGLSDPYVKIHLLPERKKKCQTKVHRRTLNPVFEETFSFGVPFAELPSRRLHFSVYDFDRFSRHDLIGHVVLDNLLEAVERGADVPIWRDILEAAGEKAELGELNFSLCYLPTAGRLTVTVIRATNLRAMDLTGYSDPYVKASLMSEGRRLKKRKTSIKKNTLNPSYNEALVFDLPQDSVRLVGLTIAVMDYDCIGHNEVIGLCHVGPGAEPRGREHWERMLANPRKPVEQWHPLVEEKSLVTPRDKPGSALENVGPD